MVTNETHSSIGLHVALGALVYAGHKLAQICSQYRVFKKYIVKGSPSTCKTGLESSEKKQKKYRQVNKTTVLWMSATLPMVSVQECILSSYYNTIATMPMDAHEASTLLPKVDNFYHVNVTRLTPLSSFFGREPGNEANYIYVCFTHDTWIIFTVNFCSKLHISCLWWPLWLLVKQFPVGRRSYKLHNLDYAILWKLHALRKSLTNIVLWKLMYTWIHNVELK